MSFLGNLISSLTGKTGSSEAPPCSLCPGNCPHQPDLCSQCLPYKEKLKEALYDVDHPEEFSARYVITAGESGGSTVCPHCGAPSSSPFICDYCGMQLAENDGKIRVTSASQIPDPVILARDIIHERHEKILSSSDSSGSLLDGILDLLDGDASAGTKQRMSREEISQAASLYGVSLSSYLNGLDNGEYLSLAGKKQADQAASASAAAGTAVAAGFGAGHAPGQTPPLPPQEHHGSPPNHPSPSGPQGRPSPAGHQGSLRPDRPGQGTDRRRGGPGNGPGGRTTGRK